MIGMPTVKGDSTAGEGGHRENTRDTGADGRHSSDRSANPHGEALHEHRPSTYEGRHRSGS